MASSLAIERGTLVTIESAQTEGILAFKRTLTEKFGAVFDRSRRSWNVSKSERDAVLTQLATAGVPYSSKPDAEAAGGHGGVEFAFRPTRTSTNEHETEKGGKSLVSFGQVSTSFGEVPASLDGGGGGNGHEILSSSVKTRSRSRSPSPKPPSSNPSLHRKQTVSSPHKKKKTTQSPPKTGEKKKKSLSSKKATEKKEKKTTREEEVSLEKMVSKLLKAVLVETYTRIVQLRYPKILEFGGRQYGGSEWLPYEFEKKPIRDARRQAVRWLEEYPHDLSEFRRCAETVTLEHVAKRPAKKKAPKKTSGGGGGGSGGGGEDGGEGSGGGGAMNTSAELRLHVSKQTKPELVTWLLQRDRAAGTPKTKVYYSDQKVAVLRDLTIKRAARNEAAQAKFRADYLERTAEAHSKLEEKRGEKRREAAETLELLEATKKWLTPGRRFPLEFVGFWLVYGQGSGPGHTNTMSETVNVEVVSYTPDPVHERDLSQAKSKHSDEVPDSRLTLRLLGDVKVLPATERYETLRRDQRLEFTISASRSSGEFRPVWRYPIQRDRIAGIYAVFGASDILENPHIRHTILRETVDDTIQHLSNYHTAIATLVADFDVE
jgi:hypothetical protein